MATAPYDSVDLIDSQAEDVQDEVYIISPVDNPIASMSRTIRATGKFHEWLEDELEPAKQNAQTEGADVHTSIEDGNIPNRFGQPTQIMTKTAQVTGTVEDVDKYGRDSEMAYQLELKYGSLANDEEIAIAGQFAGAQQTSSDAATLTRNFGGLTTQLDVNHVVDATTAATYSDVETYILDAHELCYDAGANPSYMITSPAGSRYVSNFVLSSGRSRDIRNERRLVNVIDLYVSNYGELDVVLDRHIKDVNATTGALLNKLYDYYLIDFNYLATPVLRATRDWPIAKLGDSDRRQVLRESTLAVLNTKAHAAVTGAPAGITS